MVSAPLHKNSSRLVARVLDHLNLTHPLYFASLAPDLTLIQASRNLPEIIEIPGRPVEGRPVSELFLEFVGAEEILHEILAGTLPVYTLEGVNRQQPDGSIRYLCFQVLPLEAQEPGKGLFLFIEDTSQASRLEQQLVQERNEMRLAQEQLRHANEELGRLNRQQSLFLSIAAHDLRAPLTVIQGYASLLLADLPPDIPGQESDLHEGLTIILSQGSSLNRLVSDLLDLDQLEQGKLTVHPICCDLNPLAREVAASMVHSAQLKGQTITLNLAPEPILVLADPERVRQILYNLINNALKYTSQAGRIEISSRRDEQGGALLIQDNGWGIPAAEMSRLFQLYYRTEEARHSQERGTGLGLFIVKTLVEAQGGQIEVKSQPRLGTEFIVHLPDYCA